MRSWAAPIRQLVWLVLSGLLGWNGQRCLAEEGGFSSRPEPFDLVVVGATPGGIMSAIAAARADRTVVLLDRNPHLGGLPANGLGATDIQTRGATGGLFREFVDRVYGHYMKAYGPDSAQVKDCSQGYHFEPSVAERIFEEMLAEYPGIQWRPFRQFDADPSQVVLHGKRLVEIRVTHRLTERRERYRAAVFIDATYEGDLAAAAGVPYRLGRESSKEFDEPMAGRLYKAWRGPVGPGSTGLADNAVQAYNFRLCLTREVADRVPIPKPADYNRSEYASLIEDIRQNRLTGPAGQEMAFAGVGRLVNMVRLPNGKTDANNQHLAFISTDLPEENWPWPTADWAWRDRFAERLRAYTLGLFWFAQHDPELPESFRKRCQEWGLAKSEYADNGHFPRQVYVREGRRIEGEYRFTAQDALPVQGTGRPPIHADSVTASHYALDSHAVRKREPGRVHLDGFFSHPTEPYTVPLGVMVPKQVDGLLAPVPVSGTHIGFSTLRMEPCWMALGQAAGVAAALSIEMQLPLRSLDLFPLQRRLLRQKAVLIYYRDVSPDHPDFEAIQFFGLRGFLPEWEARPDQPLTEEEAERWSALAGMETPVGTLTTPTTRGQFLHQLWDQVLRLSSENVAKIKAPSR